MNNKPQIASDLKELLNIKKKEKGEKKSLKVWGQKRTEKGVEWPKGETEEMQKLLQVEAGGQTLAEQHEGYVEWN